MGSYASKLSSHHSEHETNSKIQPPTSSCGLEKLKMCTPPISKRKLAADPRSATAGISRTPIEVACTPPGLTRRVASALPKYLQGKRYLETDFDAVTPVVTPVKCIPDPRSPNIAEQRTPIIVKSCSGYLTPVITVNQGPDMETPVRYSSRALPVADPRSPATDFDRTPILKPRSVERIAANSKENVDNESNAARLSYCETTTDYYNIPEIQAVSELAPDADESLSLENRIDLCGDSGNSISSRSSSIGDDDSRADSEHEEQVTVIRNPKILSPSFDALSASTDETKVDAEICQVNAECEQELAAKTMDKNMSDIINAVIKSSMSEPRSVVSSDEKRIKVWRDSVSPIIVAEQTVANNFEEIIIEFDDETVAKPLKSIETVVKSSKVEQDRSKNSLKKRKPLKGENKAIFDERKVLNSEAKNSIDVTKNRTPLGNRSNNHKQLVPAKSPQQIIRNKGLSARTIHQENTPPHNDRFVSKTKPIGVTQWDPDTTVVI